jgi:hypothetical protein
MESSWELVVEAIKALAWPVVAAAALLLLRHPLVELVGQLARRARKVSVFDVSVELTILPELQPAWPMGDTDPRRLSSSQIFDSASQSLFEELLKPARADYAIVDLAAGRAWLTSRLFVFSLILGEVTGLRAFVFLESAATTRRKFLGVAAPSDVRRALGRRYPWLEEACARALSAAYPPRPPGAPGASTFSGQVSPLAPATPAEQWRVSNFVRRFVEDLQRNTDPPAHERDSYLEIGTAPKVWERAHWIDGERLERDLDDALARAWVDETLDSPGRSISEAIMRRNAPFVALVDADRRFAGLVDRHALLAQMAAGASRKAAGESPRPSAE